MVVSPVANKETFEVSTPYQLYIQDRRRSGGETAAFVRRGTSFNLDVKSRRKSARASAGRKGSRRCRKRRGARRVR